MAGVIKENSPSYAEIEELIDLHGLAEVLDAMVNICWAKGEHLRTNWQDESGAKAWERAAVSLDNGITKQMRELS